MQDERMSLCQILADWIAGETPHSQEWQLLIARELGDELRAKAFGITLETVEAVLRSRSHLLRQVYANVRQLCQQRQLDQHRFLETLWHLWIPLAMQLSSHRQTLERPLIQGILGGQGTGKTTLAAVLTLILAQLGYRTLSLSIDDLYKTYAERQQLQAQDPRLIWRGPPGTHDISLGIAILDQLRQPNQTEAIAIPRFDKSAWGGVGDRTQSEFVENIDIVLFEGWFVGVRPIDPVMFNTAPSPIQTVADRTFARDINTKLPDYLPLWQRLDKLMLLYPIDYRLSQQWRQQAEQEMISTGKAGMSEATVYQFVEYFWKSLHPELFIKPMTSQSDWVDLVIEINPDHSPDSVYRPIDRFS